MNWKIQLSRRAIKDIKNLDEPIKIRVWESIINMLKHPESVDIKKLKG